MVIGEKFAWAHLPKTGGSATLQLFLLFPELIVFADLDDSNVKHAKFSDREAEIAGKTLLMNFRRLPFFVLSRAQHVARWGIHPDYKPIPMPSPQELAGSDFPDSRIALHTDNGRFGIDRWLRMEHLAEDLIGFVSELTEVSEEQREKAFQLPPVNAHEYDHELGSWFTPAQIELMYERNPVWASHEKALYGDLLRLAPAAAQISTDASPGDRPALAKVHHPGNGAPKRKVLYVLHNHPDVRPGGAEAYGLELYRAMKRSSEIEPILVARTGQSGEVSPPRHAGAPFSTVGDDPNEYFVFTDTDVCDFFFDTYRDKTLYTTYFADFLRTYKPDVVHFQHTHFIGHDVVTLARRMLPQAPILYTLHEFLPMCHRQGQLVRTMTDALCDGPSPRKCHECFPEWTPQNFFLRDRLIKSHLAQVDMFLAPSNFLLERYVDWGIPREKIMFEDYGRIPQTRFEAPVEARLRTKLGFFGQISPYKGVDVLLQAMQILSERAPDVHLALHGANLDVLPDHQREALVNAIETSGSNVTFAGPYSPDDVPRIMSEIDWVVVPSRWWENSPLVIQEAFMHGRPVICSGIGGMAEKVAHGVNGLHFAVSQPDHLAETIRLAVSTPGLWERLRDGIPQIYRMDDHVAKLSRLYDDLIAQRAGLEHEPAALTEQAS